MRLGYEKSMSVKVEIVEEPRMENFIEEMEKKLNELHNKGLKTDVKFSTSQDTGEFLYTAMIIASKN